ncbi:Putative glycoside hydrolase family 12, glycoside hydrolase family 11/12 [Colletotrichum destructivum]|uniref:Glycoside hydrolase family 12, glycoside hydrolase family 11/12 n=1 Tax=Colletotrichum destructivum TaxID=34406 RepID=A0AAX4IWX2_9PEZI|nr:Putative glycoside hydrolase family 12, glycoside hydrolase family 11/12 [Colletotrichum destructivum]
MPFLGFRWVVNFVLLAVPIGVTLGVLMGLDAGRSANGEKPLFTEPDNPGTIPKNNGITPMVSCDKAMGLHPLSKGQEYTLNPNQWGWTEGTDGALCMNVTTFNNQTYATDFSAPEFYVTWRYPRGPETQPVHAFPNIKVDGSILPVSLSSLTNVDVDVEWFYSVGNYTTGGTTASSTVAAELEENDTNTNCAIDMFLDDDKEKSKDSTKAKYEIMVWLGTFGAATQPIGYQAGAGVITTETINGTTFELFYGQNSQQQYVLTWMSTAPVPHFVGDLAPLISKLTTMNRANFPTTATYMGYMGLGSEALSATDVVTFHVTQLSMEIKASSTSS